MNQHLGNTYCLDKKNSKGQKAMNPQFSLDALSELLPYRSYDEQKGLYYNYGTTGFVLQGCPIAGANLQDQDILANLFQNKEFMQPGVGIQFLLVASPIIGPYFRWWQSFRQKGVYENLSQKRAEFLEQQAFDEPQGNLIRDFKIYISYTVPYVCKTLQQEQSLQEIKQAFIQTLKSLGVPTQNLSAQDLINDFGVFLNIKDSAFPNLRTWNRFDTLNRNIFSAEQNIEVYPTHLGLQNDYQYIAFTPKQYPKEWALCLMDGFLSELTHPIPITCPYFLHYGVVIDQNQDRQKTHALSQREALEASIKRGLSRFMPDLDDRMVESNDVVRELQKGEQVAIAGLSIGVFVKKTHKRKVMGALKSIWARLGYAFEETRFHHLPMLLSQLPMTWVWGTQKKGLWSKSSVTGWGETNFIFQTNKKTITREVQNMLPLVAEWKGQAAPGIPFVGRRGQLFFWNPFAGALLPNASGPGSQTDHNYNVCIAGQSGSGKSVFMQELMLNVLSVGGKVFVLDYGRSFEKTCKLLNGQYIEFQIKRPISLNPFSSIPVGDDPESIEERENMLAILKSTISVMSSPQQGATDLQAALIEQAIHEAWQLKRNQMTISDIRSCLLSRSEREAQNLAQQLYSFSKEGVYGKFFEGAATANFTSDIVVIETDDLRNHPSLMAVAVQMMIVHINQTMACGERKRPFLIVIDEAWQLLQGKDSAKFIAGASRTTRKYKGSLVLGTQHLTDYFKPECPAATEAFNCSTWKCVLYQEADVIEGLKEHPQLKEYFGTPFLSNLLKSVRANPPYYSEVAIFGGSVKGVVGRLKLDPFTRLLFSTNPEEFARVQALLSRGLSVFEAIEHLTSPETKEEVREVA